MPTAAGNHVGYGSVGNFYRAQINYTVTYPSDTIARVAWALIVYVSGALVDSNNSAAAGGSLHAEGYGSHSYNVGSGGAEIYYEAGTDDFPRVYGSPTNISQTFWVQSLADSIGGGARSTVVLDLALDARPAAVPSQPAQPTVTSVQQAQATVNMVMPASNGATITDTGFWIYDAASGGSVVATDSAVSTQTSAVITGLPPATNLWAEVAAKNSVGWGPRSVRRAFTTPSATTPDAPSAPTANVTSTTTADISWPTPADNGATISGYQIQVSRNESFSDLFLDTAVVASPRALTGLTPYRNYWVRVRASSNNGSGPWSAATAFTTLEAAPDAPTGLVAQALTTRTADLAFTPGEVNGSTVTGYQVQLSLDEDFTGAALPVFVLDTAQLDEGELNSAQLGVTTIYDDESLVNPRPLTGLLGGVTYYARVRTNSSSGYSDWSAVLAFQTLGGLFLNVEGTNRLCELFFNVDDTWQSIELFLNVGGAWKQVL